MFIDKIVQPLEIKGRVSQLEELNGAQLYLYGAGYYAYELAEFLNSLGVSISGFVVDDGYHKTGTLRSLPIEKISSLQNETRAFNLVVAFCGNPRQDVKRLGYLKLPNLKSIEVIDCRFWDRFPVFDYEFIRENLDVLSDVYESFSDELSQKTFCEFINAKLIADPLRLNDLCCPDQYFPADIPCFTPSKEDVFVDAGAFTGDTLSQVDARTGGCRSYTAFEPDSTNARALKKLASKSPCQSVSVFESGLWDRQTSLHFKSQDGSRSRLHDQGDSAVRVVALDQYLIPATCIKLDIEGAEMTALQGAVNTISTHRPRIAVALYHRAEDLYEIPLLLRKMCKDYRFYLRLHSYFSEELVLYATI